MLLRGAVSDDSKEKARDFGGTVPVNPFTQIYKQ